MELESTSAGQDVVSEASIVFKDGYDDNLAPAWPEAAEGNESDGSLSIEE